MTTEEPQFRSENRPRTVATYDNRDEARTAVEVLRDEGYTEIDVIEVSETQFEVTVMGAVPDDAHEDVPPADRPDA